MEFVELIYQAESWLQDSHPMWLFSCMVVLPLAPFPISPLWILAGVRFGLFGGIGVSALALIFNLSITFAIAKSLGKPTVDFLLGKFGLSVPKIPRCDEAKWILICRITPGIPLLVQNYTLGVAGVDFRRYLVISVPIQLAYAIAFIVFGNALFSGSTGYAISGVFLAVALLLAMRLIQKYYFGSVSPKPKSNAIDR